MKKTLISALILTALCTATGCEDKEAKATIAQQTQTIAQLTAENTQLKAEKEKAEKIIPAIIAQNDVIFDKEETIKYPKPVKEDEYAPVEGKIHYSVSTLKTNIEWLDKLLLEEISKNADGKPRSREQLIADYQKAYDEAKKEMLEFPISGVDETLDLAFSHQRGKLAVFLVNYYSYEGGVHGVGGYYYLNIDLETKKQLSFDDVFKPNQQTKLKELLWERYTRYGEVKDEEVFTSKDAFEVTDNFYLDHDGIHFVYNVYEIASYAEGPQELVIEWWNASALLKPEFLQKQYYPVSSNTAE